MMSLCESRRDEVLMRTIAPGSCARGAMGKARGPAVGQRRPRHRSRHRPRRDIRPPPWPPCSRVISFRTAKSSCWILKPRFGLFFSHRFAGLAAIAILLVAAKIYDDALPGKNVLYLWRRASSSMAGCVMFAVLQWMGRLYVLTDMRIL